MQLQQKDGDGGSSASTLVLVGGGHAHVQVLKELAQRAADQERLSILVVSDTQHAYYSGMMPGAVAGLYHSDDLRIDLAALAHWAGAAWLCAEVTRIDPDKQLVFARAADGHAYSPIPYDLLSIDVGSATLDAPPPDLRVIATRPISQLPSKLERFQQQAMTAAAIDQRGSEPWHVVVIGGGAAGVELSMAIEARLQPLVPQPVIVTIVSASATISGLNASAAARVKRELQDRGIVFHVGDRAATVAQDHVLLASGRQVPCDLAVWATGSAPVPLLANAGIPLCERGYILVRRTLQSVAYSNVFAAGDCCTIQDRPGVPKAGVYAVRQGPVLTQSILAVLQRHTPREYEPQSGFLALLMTGDGRAISSWKGISHIGRSDWLLKDWIDRRFIASFDAKRLGEQPDRLVPLHERPRLISTESEDSE